MLLKMCNQHNNFKIIHLGDMVFVGYNLVKLLRTEGLDIDYISYANKDIALRKEPWALSFRTTPNDSFNKIKIIKESLEHIKPYDIVHAHSIFAVPLVFIKKPFVLHLHGTDIRMYAKEFTLLGFLLRKLIKNANKIIVSTPDLLNEVSRFKREAIFLPNPVDFEIFKPFKSDVNFHDGVDFVIFHPSRHCIQKRNDILINSFSYIIRQKYDAKLVMVEWGNLLQESKKLIDKLGIKNNVEWIKPIPFMDISNFYNNSDIICDQFAIRGCLCLVTLEAMACKKSVVTFYSPQFFKRGYSKLPPLPSILSQNDVTKQIMYLLENPSLRKKISDSCFKWIHEEHSPSKIISILLKTYSQMYEKNQVSL